jgi:hypothetical protein
MKKYALVPIEQWERDMKVIVEEPSSCAAAAGNISFDNYSKKEAQPEEVIDDRLQREVEADTNNSDRMNLVEERFDDEVKLEPEPHPSKLTSNTKLGSARSLTDPEPDNAPSSSLKQTNSSEEIGLAKKTIKPVKKRKTTRISPFNVDAHNKKKIATKLSASGNKKKKIKVQV